MESLKEAIARQLPKDAAYKIFYLQTKPAYVKPLVNNRKAPEVQTDTIKIRHFLSLIDSNDTIVFGIEVLVYVNVSPSGIEQNIFISKCDTVGLFKQNIKVGPIVKALLNWLISYNLHHYNLKKKPVEPEEEDSADESASSTKKEYNIFENDTLINLKRISEKLATDSAYYSTIPYYNDSVPENRNDNSSKQLELPSSQTIKLSLFTKAAQQYLFPQSYKNQHKHVIDGVQLLNWWLKLIDSGLAGQNDIDCKLSIPGLDEISTKRYIAQLENTWSVGNIFDKDELAIYNIPLFPDDPKGRFLEHLIVENNYQKMKNNQFFEELGFRQEFRLGSVVGLIGCAIRNVPICSPSEEQSEINILSIRDYKQLMNLLKNENYNVEADIRVLVGSKIPEFTSKKQFAHEEYIDIIGTKLEQSPKKSTASNPTVINTLTVRKRKKVNGASEPAETPQINNLTGLIKRKKKPA